MRSEAVPGRDRGTSSHPTPTGQVSLNAWHAMYRILSRVQSGWDTVYLLSVARLIACTDARPCEACSRLWRPPATCDKQRAMARAWVGSTGVSSGVALRQRVQQCPGLLQVSSVKALGEPAVDRGQKVMGFLTFPLPLPESSETRGSTEFPSFCLLALGDINGLMKAVLRFSLMI